MGTGTTGSIAARTAIVRAQRQLALEAGIHLKIQSFQIKNTVGAVSLRASFNCDGFASAHSADAHFDPDSFVGLAVLAHADPRATLILGVTPPRVRLRSGVRRARASVAVRLLCPAQLPAQNLLVALDVRRNLLHRQGQVRFAETGLPCRFHAHALVPARSLPGSVAQRQLLDSFSRMLPELLRFSSAHTLLAKISDELQRAHRHDQATGRHEPELVVNSAKHRAIARADKKRGAASSQPQPAAPRKPVDLWAADDDDSAPFLDLNHGDSLASLGL